MQAPDRALSIVLVGLQGAGKSTLARGFFGESHVRINLDMLRTRPREAAILEACLASKTAFVVDNTNLTRLERARYVEAARGRAALACVWVDTPLALAITRNESREGQARLANHILVHSSRKLEPPSCAEGFTSVWRMTDGWELLEGVPEREPH